MIQTLPFENAWLSFDLGDYRPCDGTYCFYESDALPPLNENLFQGNFQWLPALSQEMKEEMAVYKQADEVFIQKNLNQLMAAAQLLHLTLPDAFVKFMSNIEWQDAIPSCTACYFDLAEKIVPCPLNSGGHLIRFLNDQQDVLLWYLYLKPTGEHCVVASGIAYDDDELEPLTEEMIKNNTFVCETSFERFIYRFWLENAIWFALDEEDDVLTKEQKDYVGYYQ
jgi:hypothetical protein